MGTPRAQLTTQKRPGAIRAPCLYYAWFGVHGRGIATTPTAHPERGNNQTHIRERRRMRAYAREHSEKIVGLEARLASLSNQDESCLGLCGRVAPRGHPSGTPSGMLPLRWPVRACPPAPKQTVPVKSASREVLPRLVLF